MQLIRAFFFFPPESQFTGMLLLRSKMPPYNSAMKTYGYPVGGLGGLMELWSQTGMKNWVVTLPSFLLFKCLTFLRGAPVASIRQMNRQVSGRSGGEYQADEQAGVTRLRWRVSGK